MAASLRLLCIALLLAVSACQTSTHAKRAPWLHQPCTFAADCAGESGYLQLQRAEQWERLAHLGRTSPAATRSLLYCAAAAYLAIDNADLQASRRAASLATRCTDTFLEMALAQRTGKTWPRGETRVAGVSMDMDLRLLSPELQSAPELSLARLAPMDIYAGARHTTAGFGVAMVARSARCEKWARCRLFPPEGISRSVTAWIEVDAAPGSRPRLVLQDPLLDADVTLQGHRQVLATDTSAPWAKLVESSRFKSLAIFGLLGGDEIARRAGLYLLEDYDPNKQPLVMLHGLASSPLIWGPLSNAVWGDPVLRRRFQIWHLVYQSNAPPLILRLRVQEYLDDAWRRLDPEGDDPARKGIVLVGHSLGGIVSRMLSADSGDTLWNAAFRVPPQSLQSDERIRDSLSRTFHFSTYPGISRVIFLAVPHHGSPSASQWVGRVMGVLVGRRVPEIQALQRVARANPEAIQPDLREAYESGWVNSIFALRMVQPVRKAGETLLPREGIPYHTIAGSLRGRLIRTDGVVPLDSALLDGAASTLVVETGHDLYRHPATIEEVMRILHASVATQPLDRTGDR